jgi:3-isopropylmalate/(R)-2-methylmalate dehydratase large subunit
MMGFTFAERILGAKSGAGPARAGEIVEVEPDVALSHDNTAAIVQIFRRIGVEKVKYPERLAVVLDHAVPPPTTRHAQNHAEIRRFVSEQGIANFYDAGRGICHQVLSEEGLILPGTLLLGADSHSTHYGALGAFSAGVGRSEMAAIWATGRLWLKVPESMKIVVEGRLQGWATSKDLALHIIGTLGADAAVYRSVEFHGEAIRRLGMESRFVLTNMMAEMGAKNAWIPPDETTERWLRDQAGVGTAGRPFFPDEDASYVEEHIFDASLVVPMVALPGRVDDAVPVEEVAGTRVQQVFIGTCTNGRLEDIAAAAKILRGRHVASGTRLLVIPASSRVLEAALKAGYIETLVGAGAMIGVPGCGPCMGNHMGIPAPGEVTLSTANRNFRGRMGTPDAPIYLAGPAVAAASAITGRITHPAEVSAG